MSVVLWTNCVRLTWTACLFLPSMSTLRSETVPSQYASTIMALFRVPLNLFVVTVLLNMEVLGQVTVSSDEQLLHPKPPGFQSFARGLCDRCYAYALGRWHWLRC